MKKGVVTIAALLTMVLLVACGQKMTEEQMYAQILDLQEKEQWEEMVKVYEDLVKTYPESEKAD